MPITDENGLVLCERNFVKDGKNQTRQQHLNPSLVKNTGWMESLGWKVVEPLEKPNATKSSPVKTIIDPPVEDKTILPTYIESKQPVLTTASSDIIGTLDEKVKQKRQYKKRK